jgi:hypothetical protein
MNTSLIAQLDQEIANKRAELAALENARAALSGGQMTNGANAPAYAGNPGKSNGKAPFGSLQDAILKALKDGPMRAGEIRSRLHATGYAYSLEPMHVSKTLLKLRNSKKLKSTGSHNNQTYHLP